MPDYPMYDYKPAPKLKYEKNRVRAERVCEYIRPYNLGEDEDNLIDALTDMMHAADLHGLHWHEILQRASHHYNRENLGPDEDSEY